MRTRAEIEAEIATLQEELADTPDRVTAKSAAKCNTLEFRLDRGSAGVDVYAISAVRGRHFAGCFDPYVIRNLADDLKLLLP